MKILMIFNDAAGSAKAGQSTPNGHYNIEKMLHGVIRRGGTVTVGGTGMDAGGLTQEKLTEGALRSTPNEMTALTAAADRILVF